MRTSDDPPSDTWVEVVGVWQPAPGEKQPDVPVVRATSIEEIPQPLDPYDSS